MAFYIEKLLFKCNGCGAKWSAEVNDHLSAEQLSQWLKDPEKMKSCPSQCGSRTCDVAFKLHGAKA